MFRLMEVGPLIAVISLQRSSTQDNFCLTCRMLELHSPAQQPVNLPCMSPLHVLAVSACPITSLGEGFSPCRPPSAMSAIIGSSRARVTLDSGP